MSALDPTAQEFPHLSPTEQDPELTALPAPPRARRLATMSVMALVVAAALALVLSLSADLRYFFTDGDAVQLGLATHLEGASDLPANRFVQVEGTPMASTAVRYRRLVGSGHYTVFPLAGQRNVYVQVPFDDARAEQMFARREFDGRLVTFGQLGGRFSPVRRYLEQRMRQPVSDDSYLLLVDEPPSSYLWALLLALFCLGVAGVDAWLLLRWFRPLPAE